MKIAELKEMMIEEIARLATQKLERKLDNIDCFEIEAFVNASDQAHDIAEEAAVEAYGTILEEVLYDIDSTDIEIEEV